MKPDAAHPGGVVAALVELAASGAAVVAGVVIAIGLLFGLYIPRFGIAGDLDRVRGLGALLDRPAAQGPPLVAIVSNSVGVEGVSASVVNRSAGGGWEAANYSANGLDILAARLMIGKILVADPAAVVWIIRPELLGRPNEISGEFAMILRAGNYQDHAVWLTDPTVPGLDDATRDRLTAPTWRNMLDHRSVPSRALSEWVRQRSRRGILPAKPTDLDAPFQMDLMIDGAVLDRHLDDIAFSLDKRLEGGDRSGADLIEATVEDVARAGAKPVIVLAPCHPRLEEKFAPAQAELLVLASRLTAEHGGVVIDASGLLDSTGFADAIHPNAEGRAAFSAFLGEQLAPVLQNRP